MNDEWDQNYYDKQNHKALVAGLVLAEAITIFRKVNTEKPKGKK